MRDRTLGRMLVTGWVALGLGLAGCGGDSDEALDLSPAAEAGRSLIENEGCAACHGGDGRGVVGPRLAGLIGSEVEMDDGTTLIADEAYIRRSIMEPEADLRAGFSVRMPVNTLTDEEIDDVIAYLRELP